jgi:hypothetical protein
MKSSDVLARLFGSINRVKFIRLFLLNPKEVFSFKDASKRVRANSQSGRREISLLKNIGLIKPASEYAEVIRAKNKKKKKRIHGWKLDESFPLLFALKNFILDSIPLAKDQVLKKLQKAGRLKLVVLSGFFCEGGGSRVDVLVVGDGIKKGLLEKIIRNIEAETGKELTYVAFNTNEFTYRMGVYDKLIRDIFDYPHEKLLDKIGI